MQKQKLLDICRSQLMETITNLKDVIEEAQKSANEYGPPKDRYDAFRTQLLRKRDMFAQQLVKNNELLDILNKINIENRLEQVELGAMVITDAQKLFISIGLGKIDMEGETWYAISPAVPIFKALQGKRAGDSFEFNGRKFKVLEIN